MNTHSTLSYRSAFIYPHYDNLVAVATCLTWIISNHTITVLLTQQAECFHISMIVLEHPWAWLLPPSHSSAGLLSHYPTGQWPSTVVYVHRLITYYLCSMLIIELTVWLQMLFWMPKWHSHCTSCFHIHDRKLIQWNGSVLRGYSSFWKDTSRWGNVLLSQSLPCLSLTAFIFPADCAWVHMDLRPPSQMWSHPE